MLYNQVPSKGGMLEQWFQFYTQLQDSNISFKTLTVWKHIQLFNRRLWDL